jgi:tetratricopeptide (TPR) repeat protein
MKTARELLDELAGALHSRTLAVWYGAGTSIPSGLPSAKSLVEKLLASLPLSADEQAQIAGIVTARLPLEHLMETVLEGMDSNAQGDLLGLFRFGQPSAYHVLLAQLGKLGMVRMICTTNFDMHIEAAFEAKDLRRNRDYEVWHDPQEFGGACRRSETVHLLKLHGSVEVPDKLGVTVRRIASPGPAQHVRTPVEYVFGGTGATDVLVVGYSFSDKFDISPVIRQCGEAGSTTRVIVLDYSFAGDHDFTVTDHPIADNHPLRPFANKWFLRGDSAEVIAELSRSLGIGMDVCSDASVQPSGPDWRSRLDKFFADLATRNHEIPGHYLAGSVMTMIGADRGAIKYYEQAAHLAEHSGDARWRLATLQALAGGYIRLHEPDLALAALNQAEPLAARTAEGKFSDHVLSQRGSLYHQLGDDCYQRARQLHDSALTIARESGDPLRCMPHLSGVAAAWMKLGDFDAAQQAYEHALRMVETSGDLYRKAELYGNIGSMEYILRDYRAATQWYIKARDTSGLCGDSEREGIHWMNLGNVYVKLKQYDEAMVHYCHARGLLSMVLWDGHPILKLLDQHEHVAIQRSRRHSDGGGPHAAPSE